MSEYSTQLKKLYDEDHNFKIIYDKLSQRIELYSANKGNIKQILTDFKYSAEVINGSKIINLASQPIATFVDEGYFWTYLAMLVAIPDENNSTANKNYTIKFCHFNHTYYSTKEKNCLISASYDKVLLRKIAEIMYNLAETQQCNLISLHFKKYLDGYNLPAKQIEYDLIHACMLLKIIK